MAESPGAADDPPLSEQTLLSLRRVEVTAAGPLHLLVTGQGPENVLGYAHLSTTATVTAELVTNGDAAVADLIGAAIIGKATRAWAHGHASAAAELAQRAGWQSGRVLLQLRRALPVAPVGRVIPAGATDITIRPFKTGQDEQAVLKVNAAAFAGHPEQGSWTLADLAARTASAWFDPDGLFVAVQHGELVGFHWTKVHPAFGEVYVLAVDPAAQGRGLGQLLLHKGLEYLAARGSPTVALYVEEINEPAVGLYLRAGFTRFSEDVQYKLPKSS